MWFAWNYFSNENNSTWNLMWCRTSFGFVLKRILQNINISMVTVKYLIFQNPMQKGSHNHSMAIQRDHPVPQAKFFIKSNMIYEKLEIESIFWVDKIIEVSDRIV